MKKKIRIQNVSAWSIGITLALALLFAVVSIQAEKEFRILKKATDQYIVCENAAKQLQDGADYLTEQVRLYAMTADMTYLKLYFEEAEVTRRREHALENLEEYFADTEIFQALQDAMDSSENLMNTEYYSMKLVAEAKKTEESDLPQQIQELQLSEEDMQLSDEEKIEKAQQIVCDTQYQSARVTMTEDVTRCMDNLIEKTRNRQGRADTIFSDMYLKLELGIGVMVILLLAICIMVRRLIVVPLLHYNESIHQGRMFSVMGAAELQNLAITYNRVFEENKETQRLIRHQAEHDALTDSLNRGSFEKLLQIYENGEKPFALLLIDVDTFKEVNDTYGHATGDAILKKVTRLLKQTFRSIDYVCRIGGDEFAVIMADIEGLHKEIVREKIQAVNKELTQESADVPAVSLSVGIAFSDREHPEEDIFKDADKALYYVKEHGRNGCEFYEEWKEKRKADEKENSDTEG